MGTTVILKKVLKRLLEQHCEYAYYRKAKRASGTYLVWYLDQWTSGEVGSDLMLEVHVISRNAAPEEADTLADTIWTAFDHFYYLDEDIEVNIYQNTRGDVEEDETNLFHRRLVFSLRVF